MLLDVFADDPHWGDGSSNAMAIARNSGALIVNPLIYADLSISLNSSMALDSALDQLSIRRDPLPYDAGFPAGAAFVEYRRRGGSRTSTLPVFYIGAHAAVAGHRLLTRDAGRYATYFPGLRLITP